MTAHRKRNAVTAYLNESPVAQLNVLTVNQVINGRRINRALMELEYPFRDFSLHQDAELSKILEFDPQSGIKLGDPIKITRIMKDGPTEVIHRGIVTSLRAGMSKNGETTQVESRFDHFLVSQNGEPIIQSEWIEFTDGSWRKRGPVDRDIVLNPVIDGRPCPNMWDEGYSLPLLPIDIDAVPADWYNSANFTDTPTEIQWWSISRVIEWLFENYNDETYVTNPKREDLDLIFDKDEEQVRDLHVRRGTYIPEILDQLLLPLGFSWMYLFDDQSGKTTVDFWKRNSAYRNRDVKLQRFGSVVNVQPSEQFYSEVADYNITMDAFNRTSPVVQVAGDFERFESTFELVPAWDPQYDNVDVFDLSNDSAAMEANPELRRVFRDWVLNEAGDYKDYAQHVNRLNGVYYDGMRFAYDFSVITGWGNWVAARRRFLPTITVDPVSGTPAGIFKGVRIEIWVPSEGKWIDPSASPYPFRAEILKNECGVTIGGKNLPPIDLWTQFKPLGPSPNDTFRVRVTATVESDNRISYTKSGDSLATIPIKQVIDVGSKYQRAVVDTTSGYFNDTAYQMKELDSVLELQAIAEDVWESWNVAMTSGKITLESIDTPWRLLGRQISGMQPRGLTLQSNVTSEQNLNPIYPTVVGLTYDVQGQQTVLELDIARNDIRRF